MQDEYIKGGKGTLEKKVRAGVRKEVKVKNSSHEHLKCDTLVEYIKVQ